VSIPQYRKKIIIPIQNQMGKKKGSGSVSFSNLTYYPCWSM